MISILKYLQSSAGGQVVRADPAWAEVLFGLCSGLLDCIIEHVLSDERSEELRSQFADTKALLRPDLDPEEASHIEQAASKILAAYRASAKQNATNTAVEMQHILGMLNQALMVLAGGSERSISRLQQIQDSLQRTSMLQDIIALKSSLAETVRFVQEESAREQQTSSKEFATFESDVRKARKFLGSNFKGLPGRPEGVRAISEEIVVAPPNQTLYVVAFLFDRLDALVQRYGEAVADELTFRVIKERLQAVAAVSTAYRWTPSSLVGVFYRARDVAALRAQLAALNRTPLVHRAALGNRIAVLTVSPSYMVAEAVSDLPAPLIEEVDRFTGTRL